MGNVKDRSLQFIAQFPDQVSDLRFQRHIQGRGWLIGDEERWVGLQRQGDHNPLAHAARELVRVILNTLRRVRDTDPVEHLYGALAGVASADGLVIRGMSQDGIHHLLFDAEYRIQAGHGVLKDHGNIATPHLAHFLFTHAAQVASLEEKLSIGDLSVGRQQAHHRRSDGAFTAARLADQPNDLSTSDFEINIPDRRESCLAGVVFYFQIYCFEGYVHYSPLVPDKRGSSTSRSASPNRVNPSVVNASVTPDQRIGHWDSKM